MGENITPPDPKFLAPQPREVRTHEALETLAAFLRSGDTTSRSLQQTATKTARARTALNDLANTEGETIIPESGLIEFSVELPIRGKDTIDTLTVSTNRQRVLITRATPADRIAHDPRLPSPDPTGRKPLYTIELPVESEIRSYTTSPEIATILQASDFRRGPERKLEPAKFEHSNNPTYQTEFMELFREAISDTNLAFK